MRLFSAYSAKGNGTFKKLQNTLNIPHFHESSGRSSRVGKKIFPLHFVFVWFKRSKGNFAIRASVLQDICKFT